MTKTISILRKIKCQYRTLAIYALVALSAFVLTGCSSFFNLPAEKLLSQALANLVSSKSMVARVEITNPNFESSNPFTAPAQAITDQVDHVKLTIAADYRKRTQAATAVNIVADKKEKRELEATLYIDSQDLYFKLDKLPEIENLDFSELVGATYKMPITDIAGTLPSHSSLNILGLDLQKRAVANAIKQKPDLFKDIKELDQQELNGEQARRFTARLDEGAFKELARELSTDPDFDPDEVVIPEALANQPIEIWVGQKTKSIIRLKSVTKTAAADTSQSLGEQMLDVIFSDFNKDLGLTTPSDAEELNLLELMEKLGNTVDIPELDTSQLEKGLDDLEQLFDDFETNGSTNIDIGNSTLPGLDEVPFPVQ